MFDCAKCGKCCENLQRNLMYKHLDNGNGLCKYYDEKTKLCTIYVSRPLICNIDAYYDKYMSDSISREEWYTVNHRACEKLQKF